MLYTQSCCSQLLWEIDKVQNRSDFLGSRLDRKARMASQFAEFNNGVTFEQAVHLVRQEINANYEVILRDLAPQEVFVQYQAEVSQLWFPWN